MKVYVDVDHRAVAIASSTHALVFRKHSSRHNHKQSSVRVQIDPASSLASSSNFKLLIQREVHGCLGLIEVAGDIYVAVVTGAATNVAHPVPYESVNKIYAVDFVSITNNEWDYVNLDANGMPVAQPGDLDDGDSDYSRGVHPCWEFKKLLSNGSFYFSNDFDLTSLLQNRGVNQSKLKRAQHSQGFAEETTRVNTQHYQEQFMWNSFMMDELVAFRNRLDDVAAEVFESNRFLTTVIRGFAKTVNLSPRDSITIVSKQSWKRAGTRFNARGIDDDGNVANFVETEFVYNSYSLKLVYAFTQIRGSVPAFWEQDSSLINPKLTVTRSREATQPSFDKHFTEICQKYGVCHIVNLLSKTKSQEVEVLRRYRELLASSVHREEVAYSHFDFHAETKQLSGGFAGASKILPLLYDSLEQFSWFSFDVDVGETVTRQDGVFRVNCLDCLDRTNLIEQVICQRVLEHIIKNLQVPLRMDEVTPKHNALWADNGDAISQIYTGTNALKLSFSRSGKMNIAGALSDVTKSVSRMYQNTFVDQKRQSTMDTLLGKDVRLSRPVQIYDPINEYVSEQLRQHEGEYTSHSGVSIWCGTFNVNAGTPLRSLDLSEWLFPASLEKSPDIYAVGLQELIELNAGSILAADTSRPKVWAQFLQDQLNSQNEQYLLLRTEAIASMCILFFVKNSCVQQVTEVSGSSKKTGLGGMTANKGACAVRFNYGATSFALVTSHLAAGVSATMERHNDFNTIMLGLTFTRNYSLSDHDHVIWFGDLNYRINLSNQQCRSMVEQNAFAELSRNDQLQEERSSRGGAFFGFEERQLNFPPTYKFDKGTSDYDTSEKQRIPSWTDRVLFRSYSDDKLEIDNYNAVMDVYVSDHKPVYATGHARVKHVDEKKKRALLLQYYIAYKTQHGEATSGSLIDFEDLSDTAASSLSNSSTFASETLSEMNLPREAKSSTPPLLPLRPNGYSVPRRVPPPPMSRKATELTIKEPEPSPARVVASKPVPPTPTAATSPPPAPPSRSSTRHNFDFSAAPLIPSSTPTPRSMSPKGPSESILLKPMKPVKPQSLSSHRVEGDDDSKDVTAATKPPPPPARTSRAAEAKVMSDWKPLLPQ